MRTDSADTSFPAATGSNSCAKTGAPSHSSAYWLRIAEPGVSLVELLVGYRRAIAVDASGAELLSDIDVVGIVIERGDVLGEESSDVVAAAVPVAAAEVVETLRQQRRSSTQGGSSMHEAGVTERILEVVLEHANEAHAHRVTDVYLDVGEASGIDTDSVELHWPLLSEGSVAEGAVLHFSASEAPFTFRLTSIEVDEPS